MTEFSKELESIKRAFASLLKDLITSRDKRIEELCEEVGRLKLELDISNEKLTRALKGDIG